MKTKKNPPTTEENLMKAISEYLVWLNEKEIELDDVGNFYGRDAAANCSSKLCELLIEKEIYVRIK